MIEFENIVHISRSARGVYDYLVDLEHTPEWNWAIDETRKTTPGPTRVGTRYVQTRSTPRPGTEELEIVELEPGSYIAIEGTLTRFEARITYLLEERQGRTRLTNRVTLAADGALRLAEPLVAPRIKSAVADNLNELAARLESPVRGDTIVDEDGAGVGVARNRVG